jgi:hypothetical protein
VVTHSPFVTCSLNEGWIHRFTRGKDAKVKISKTAEWLAKVAAAKPKAAAKWSWGPQAKGICRQIP